MHELSIAEALLEQVRRHLPPTARLQRVTLRVGPMRAIEPQAMQWAWQAITRATPCATAELVLDMLPWSLHCPSCGRNWQAADLFQPCVCGCETSRPTGGNELQLLSLDYDLDPAAPAPAPTLASGPTSTG